MKSAKIISSNSHIDYVARVYDEPSDGVELEFATFVSFQLDSANLVGVIYDSKLVNPQLNSYTPRLSRRSTLGDLASDTLNEPGVLVGIILLGAIKTDGNVVHGIPPQVIPHGSELHRMAPAQIKAFHREPDGSLKLHYYSQVLGNTGPLGVPLMESIIDQLNSGCGPEEKRRLEVLRQTLKWQRTIGSLR
jgi:hypothetical protein